MNSYLCDLSGMKKQTAADRLQEARKSAGYVRPTDAANAFGWTVSTYLAHENGTRNMKPEIAEQYAKAYKADPAWILYGKKGQSEVSKIMQAMNFLHSDEALDSLERGQAAGVRIDELDVSAAAGPGTLDGGINQEIIISADKLYGKNK